MLHALINPSNEIDRVEENINPNTGTKSGWKWLPVEWQDRPVYNPKFQITKGPEYVVESTKVTVLWSIRDKTEEELENDKSSTINNIDPIIFTILFNQENKIRNLNNLANFTVEEYKFYLKSLL